MVKQAQRYDQLGWPNDCDFWLHGKKDRSKDGTIKKFTRLIVVSIAPNSQTMSMTVAIVQSNPRCLERIIKLCASRGVVDIGVTL